jgi:hypothetical protein
VEALVASGRFGVVLTPPMVGPMWAELGRLFFFFFGLTSFG